MASSPFPWGTTPGSFRNQAVLQVQDLKSRPELNGQEATVVSEGVPGRWGVRVGTEAAPISVAGAKLRLQHCGELRQEVVAQGVPGHPELDGQRVQCGAFHADRGAWAVWPAAAAGAPLSAPASALTDPGTGAALTDPVEVRPIRLGGQPQQALVAARPFGTGDVIFYERSDVVVEHPPQDVSSSGFAEVFWQLARAVPQFLRLPAARRQAVLALYAREAFSVALVVGVEEVGKDNVKVVTIPRDKVLGGIAAAGQDVPPAEVEDVWRFVRVWNVNAFPVEGGTALSVTMSRVNHGCRPNAVRAELPDRTVALVALRPVAAGEELRLSYVSDMQLLQPKAMRQQALRSWFDACECPVCAGDAEAMQSARCFQKKKCRGAHAMVKGALQPCDKCGAPVKPADQKRLEEEERTYAQLFVSIDHCPEAISDMQCKMMLHGMDQVEKLFSPGHWLSGRFHGLLVEYEEQALNFSSARRHALSIVDFLDHHLDRPSIRRPLQRMVVARLEGRQDERLKPLGQLLAGLAELSVVLPGSHGYVADFREAVEKVLQS